MANPNNPHGLASLGTNIHGGALVLQQLTKAVGDGRAIYRNDVVARLAGGALTGTLTPGTTVISGVAINYGAASTATDHAVIVDPGGLYEGQTASTGFAATDLGVNANLTNTAGSTTTKLSAELVDESTKATTSTLDVHLYALYANVDNAYGAYNRIEVVLNKSRMNGATAGV